MRILWFGHNLAFPPAGGVLQRNYNLLREAAKSCEVHVLAFDQPATRPPGVTPQDCVAALEKFCKKVDWLRLSLGDMRVNRYWLAFRGLASTDPFATHWLRSREMTEKLRGTLRDKSFDLVHFDTLGLAQYRPMIRNSAAVLNHHNVESSMMARRASNAGNILTRHYFARETENLCKAEQRWCPQFGVNLVVSAEEEQLLRASAPGVATAVVPNGVDTDYFMPRPDPGGRTLLFCGGLTWYPNREAMEFFFGTIWQKLSEQLTDVEIYVVGRKPPKWLKELAARDDRIHVLGFVDDVRPYFRKATAYVCPIRNGGGTRLKILDALAMGVPVIATSFACSGLSLERGKHVLLAETPDEFIHQIEQGLSNTTLRMSLAANAREIVEREYSWSIIRHSVIQAYENACRGPSAAKVDWEHGGHV